MEKIKIVMIGDSQCGKTSIINQYVNQNFNENENPTIGIDFFSKQINITNDQVKCQFWDTAGQEKYSSLIPQYLRDSKIVLIVYDITRQDSYIRLEQWIDQVKSHSTNPLICLIGNKCDLKERRQVSYDDGIDLAKQHQLKFYEISAKNGYDNIEKIIKETCDEIIERIKQEKEKEKQKAQEELEIKEVSLSKQEQENDILTQEQEESKIEPPQAAKINSTIQVYTGNSQEPFFHLAIKPGANLKLFITNKKDKQEEEKCKFEEKFEILFQVSSD